MSSSLDRGPPSLPFPVQFAKSLLCSPPPPPKDLNLTGQVGIVTGGNRGLGYETADLLLSYKLSRLIITVRDEKSGEEAAAKLKLKLPNSEATTIEVWNLDMLSYDSIQAFAKRCASLPRIDFVILNAGIMNNDFVLDKTTKHELNVQVNYLSTILLTFLLLPVLRVSKTVTGTPSRITLAGSGLAFVASFPEKTADAIIPAFDKQPPQPWSVPASMDRYSTTKLLLLFFVSKLKEVVHEDDVVVNVADPGFVRGTSFDRTVPTVTRVITGAIRGTIGRSLRAGVWNFVDAAVLEPKTSHGSWIYNWQVFS